MYRPVLVSAPSEKPVSRAEAKAALDISYTDKDTLIDGLIDAAISHLDGWTGILGRALCEQEWRQDYDRLSWCLRLPLFPIISVDSVKYDDASGVEQTIAPASWTLKNDGLGAYVEFISTFAFPATSIERAAVRIAYTAGYETGGDEPMPIAIKQAILLMVRQWFDNPTSVIVGQTVQEMPMAAKALIAPLRRVRF